jgi:hypothetical protein
VAAKHDNLVQQTATTTGTGDFTLSAVNGKRTFDSVWSHGATTDLFWYFISNRDVAGEWEVGTGHMSAASTMVRDTVLASSAGGTTKTTFSAGTKDVVNDIPAASQAITDIQSFLASGTWTAPAGTTGKELVCIEIWDSGASGGTRTTTGSGGGGSGGCYHRIFTTIESLNSTETVTVGAQVAGVSGVSNGGNSNRSSVTLAGTTFTPTGTAATGGTNASATTGAGASTAGVISTQATVTGEAGQASPNTAASYVAATGTFMKAPQAGATACSTAANGGNGAGLGGTILHLLGRGGVAGTNVGGNGGGGTVPGGGGGGAVQGGTSGVGAAGEVIITTFLQ